MWTLEWRWLDGQVDPSHREVVVDDVVHQHVVEVQSEFVRQQIHMRNIRVVGIILHHHQHAPVAHPLRDLVCVFRGHVMRVGSFRRIVR